MININSEFYFFFILKIRCDILSSKIAIHVTIQIQSHSTAPIDGHWGRWSSWSECSAKCGQGQKQRQRKCNDPVPSHGGQGCSGVASESKACEIMPCGLGK